jgi:membrane protease subunit HflC
MKNFWGILIIVLVVAVLGFKMFTYQVRQTESALVVRFGKPVRPTTEPGLYLRLPMPIERVYKFDSRRRIYEGVMEETTTAGGEPIIVLSYLVWKVEDPLLFLTSVQDVTGAEAKLRDLLRNAQNSVIGRHYFNEFVNTDPGQIRFEEIEQEICDAIREIARSNYGIEVSAAGLKRLMISEKVTKDVFERMRADRKGKAEAILAAGNAEAERIHSDAEAKQKELLAFATTRAQEIRGAGDAAAASYYDQLKEDPELAMFLRNLEMLKKTLKERTTIILGTDTEPMKLLKEPPALSPQEIVRQAQPQAPASQPAAGEVKQPVEVQ